MDKVLNIDGRDIGFRVTASTPMRYRHRFSRDIFEDLVSIKNKFVKGEDFALSDLEAFEYLSYIMAKQYDPSIPDTPEDWLDTFELFSITEIYPEILDLWVQNEAMTSTAKKK